MLTIRAMSDGKGYSSRHLEHGDYYAEGERVLGHWQGRGAELLGLAGEVKQEDFESLRQGLDPRTGEFLRQRKSADRVMPDGTVQSHGRNLYDFTISALKSVSVMAILGGDKRLITAHENAVAEALKEIESHAGARIRLNKANDNRITGNMVIALYHHDASRELDPQIHTHAVAACDALRILEKESRLKSIELVQVQRQTAEEYREAIKELRRDPANGFEKLDAMGAIHEVRWLDRAQAVSRAFADAEAKGRNALAVCATHEEIDRVTETIRTNRKQRGKLGNSIEIGRDVSLNWTTAQKSDARNFRTGQVLVFHRAVKGIDKNQALEVVRIDGNQTIARGPQGEQMAITSKHAKSFDVCERRDFEVALGDKLLITANRRGQNFRCTNGEIVTVSNIDHERRITLTDGRILPFGFRQFTHGYAVTAHRSQGKSVDEVIISRDGMRKELFYVAASRGREGLQIITSDKELLRESVGLSNARQSASELERRERPGLHQGMNCGLALARNLARRAAQFISELGKPLTLTRELSHQPIVENSHDWGIE